MPLHMILHGSKVWNGKKQKSQWTKSKHFGGTLLLFFLFLFFSYLLIRMKLTFLFLFFSISYRTKKVLPLFKSLSFCPTTNINYFETLPNEVILLIFDYLDTPDLGRLAQTCKLFSYLAHDFSVTFSSFDNSFDYNH